MLYSAAGAGTQGVILGSSLSLNATSSPTSTSQVHVTSRTLYLIWMRNGLGREFCLLPPHPSFDRTKIQNVSELENGKNVAYFSLELGRCFNAEEHVREKPKVPPPCTSPASWVSSRRKEEKEAFLPSSEGPNCDSGDGIQESTEEAGQANFFFFLKRSEKETTCDKLAKTERSLEGFSSSPHNEQGDPE